MQDCSILFYIFIWDRSPFYSSSDDSPTLHIIRILPPSFPFVHGALSMNFSILSSLLASISQISQYVSPSPFPSFSIPSRYSMRCCFYSSSIRPFSYSAPALFYSLYLILYFIFSLYYLCFKYQFCRFFSSQSLLPDFPFLVLNVSPRSSGFLHIRYFDISTSYSRLLKLSPVTLSYTIHLYSDCNLNLLLISSDTLPFITLSTR